MKKVEEIVITVKDVKENLKEKLLEVGLTEETELARIEIYKK